MPTSWDDLAALTLARQFPEPVAEVGAMVEAVGPVQTQTARSAFIGLAARFPGVTHAAVSAAYEGGEIVRGSTIRGTVHTATPQQFAVLREACRTTMATHWRRQLGLERVGAEEAWEAVEQHASVWRTPDELRAFLRDWLHEHEGLAAAEALDSPTGRHVVTASGGLVRRPVPGARWEGQGAPVYRRFDAPGASLVDLVRTHLSSHGPASREDIAWWSGLPLGVVDSLVGDLEGLVSYVGPDERTYLDLPDVPAPRDLSGVRLLPEFDALLCAYHSKRRDRFVTPADHARLVSRANGLMSPALLVDGRITGTWRSVGTARRRPLEVTWFAGTRRPRKGELEAPVAALEEALDITVTRVDLTRAGPA
ncbi:MAG: winged helix DNA-binding domain-containing protein [Nocardioides sp.]|nr:winged helix DNA-binding domain-containing protein [Nocardioides sp.]